MATKLLNDGFDAQELMIGRGLGLKNGRPDPNIEWSVEGNTLTVEGLSQEELDEGYNKFAPVFARDRNTRVLVMDLRIQDYLPRKTSNVKSILTRPFNTLGLVGEIPEYDKGRKFRATHTTESGDLVVERTFKDIPQDNGDIWIQVDFFYYTNGNAVGLSKTEMVKLNQLRTGELKRKRRERAIAYLTEGASKFGLDDELDQVYELTHSSLAKFEKFGDRTWLETLGNAFTSSDSSDLKSALSSEIPSAAGYPAGTTIYHVILASIN